MAVSSNNNFKLDKFNVCRTFLKCILGYPENELTKRTMTAQKKGELNINELYKFCKKKEFQHLIQKIKSSKTELQQFVYALKDLEQLDLEVLEGLEALTNYRKKINDFSQKFNALYDKAKTLSPLRTFARTKLNEKLWESAKTNVANYVTKENENTDLIIKYEVEQANRKRDEAIAQAKSEIEKAEHERDEAIKKATLGTSQGDSIDNPSNTAAPLPGTPGAPNPPGAADIPDPPPPPPLPGNTDGAIPPPPPLPTGTGKGSPVRKPNDQNGPKKDLNSGLDDQEKKEIDEIKKKIDEIKKATDKTDDDKMKEILAYKETIEKNAKKLVSKYFPEENDETLKKEINRAFPALKSKEDVWKSFLSHSNGVKKLVDLYNEWKLLITDKDYLYLRLRPKASNADKRTLMKSKYLQQYDDIVKELNKLETDFNSQLTICMRGGSTQIKLFSEINKTNKKMANNNNAKNDEFIEWWNNEYLKDQDDSQQKQLTTKLAIFIFNQKMLYKSIQNINNTITTCNKIIESPCAKDEDLEEHNNDVEQCKAALVTLNEKLKEYNAKEHFFNENHLRCFTQTITLDDVKPGVNVENVLKDVKGESLALCLKDTIKKPEMDSGKLKKKLDEIKTTKKIEVEPPFKMPEILGIAKNE